MEDRPDIGRRRVLAGAAWSVPIIAVSAPAPAFALSPVACDQMPAPASWTTTTSGTFASSSTGGYAWSGTPPYNFNIYRDNGSSTAVATITTSTTLNVVNGTVYAISTPIYWGYGNGVASQSTPISAKLTMGGTTVFNYTTRTAPLGTGTVGTTTTVSSSYTATTTGSIAVVLTFTISPRTLSANDDIILTAPTFACSR